MIRTDGKSTIAHYGMGQQIKHETLLECGHAAVIWLSPGQGAPAHQVCPDCNRIEDRWGAMRKVILAVADD